MASDTSTSLKRKRSIVDTSGDDITEAGEPEIEAESSDEVEIVTSTTRVELSSAAQNKEALRVKGKKSFAERWKTNERTPQEVLDAQREQWTSPVYQHFAAPEIIVVSGEVKYRFVCKKHPQKTVVRARSDDSTSNLSRHVTGCTGRPPPPGQQAITTFAGGSSYSEPKFRYLLVRWVARHHRPYSIIQDEELIEIMRMLYAAVNIPHRTTLSRDVRDVFGISQLSVAQVLQEHDGRLHLCIDGWTSPNIISFLGITVHRVLKGKMDSFILDFVKLTSAHTGEYLAQQLKETLELYGISNKIMAITCDNASNNDIMISELESSLGGINGAETRIRCFAHVLNLVVKAILSGFTKAEKTPQEDVEEPEFDDEDTEALDESTEPTTTATLTSGSDYVLNPDANVFDDEMIEEIIAEVAKEHKLTDAQRRFGKAAVTKIVNLAKRVFHSPSMRADLSGSCSKEGIPDQVLLRVVRTRWNSFVSAIKRAIDLRPALDKFLKLSKYDKKDGLQRFKLTASEWQLLVELRNLLLPFLSATNRISQSDTPLLHEVIPVIDILTGHLEDAILNTNLSPAVRVAAARGMGVLNRYYARTDDSAMYRGAMIFHPRYKADYFRQQGWLDVWIDEAFDTLRKKWAHYKPSNEVSAVSASEGSGEGSGASTSAAKKSKNPVDLFAQLDDIGPDPTTDALEEWLKSPPLPKVKCPLQYWTAQLDVGNEPLARMALDFLSAPAASTDVERAFSHGGLTVSKRRHALSDKSTRAATVLGSWAKKADILPEAQILAMFADKRKRTKKAKVSDVPDEVDNNDVVLVDA